MVRAVEKGCVRLLETASALNRAGIPHTVAGGNVVDAWAAHVEEAAVRNMWAVDILLRCADLPWWPRCGAAGNILYAWWCVYERAGC